MSCQVELYRPPYKQCVVYVREMCYCVHKDSPDDTDHYTLIKRCVELEDEIEQHTTQINTLLTDLSKLHSILSDPESVFINMKAGRIAKPSLRSILELYDHQTNL